MSLNVAIQMDPIDRIDIGGDFHVRAGARGANPRPQTLFYYLPQHLAHRDGKLVCPRANASRARRARQPLRAG